MIVYNYNDKERKQPAAKDILKGSSNEEMDDLFSLCIFITITD